MPPASLTACRWQKHNRIGQGRGCGSCGLELEARNGSLSGVGAERVFASRRESARSTPPVEPEVRSLRAQTRDLRRPGVRSDGADRPPGGARQSFRPPDPALVVVLGHLCSSPNGSDSGGRSAEHNTPQHEVQKIRYPWHYLYGQQIFVRRRHHRFGREICPCYLAGKRLQDCFEVPAWMLDHAHCLRLRAQAEPEVDWEALVRLQQLLTTAARAVVKSSCPKEIAGKKGATSTYVPKEVRDSSETNQPLRSPCTTARVGTTATGDPSPSDRVIERAASQPGGPTAPVPRRAQ
jgi:hypothetical protein